ncbi:glutamate carboxypeptidase [Bradyrhizobium sp. BR 10261]|uniref:glutamate carboxypeptidase n=1 Tax=Bradyrhizobium sp. BR 10261 TaxID=2749992 RepID=UPI00201BE56B|nr:glutamate carboxypeptidase [Bradyrhizobium sp. BR 10261]
MSEDNPPGLERAAWQLVDPFIESTRRMVEIESPSLDDAGLLAMQKELSRQVVVQGGEIELIPATKGPGNNLIARWKGKGKTNVLLVGHMDTVYPSGILQTFPFRQEAGRIYGPGVLDDKGGIAMALMAVRLLREAGRDNFGMVTLLATTDEEKQSAGSKDLIRSMAKESDVAFILEFGTPDDRIVLSRKGIGYFRIEVTGKAAHAGAEPEKGCNAVAEIAYQIVQMRQLERIELDTSFNFTLLSGGERSNIIPAEAKAQADVRVLRPGEFDRLEEEAAQLAKVSKLFPCSVVHTSLERGRPPFPLTEETGRLVERAQSIYREIGMDLRTEASGAGTDGNYTSAAGTTTLDGLGPVGGGAHTAGAEYVEEALIAPRIYLLARLIEDVSRPPASK